MPGHESSPFRRSFDSELLAVLAPQRLVMLAWQQQPALPPLLARAVHPRPMLDLHSFLNLLGGVVLNRRLQIAVQCIGGSRWCTLLVACDGLGLCVLRRSRRADLLLAVGVGRPELALPGE